MCLSLPARVISIEENAQVAEVEVNESRKRVFLALDKVRVGDWVLIYGGVALTVLEADIANETINLLKRLIS